MHRLSEIGEDGTFGPVLGPGLEYQIRVAEYTVTTDAKCREGRGSLSYYHNEGKPAVWNM